VHVVGLAVGQLLAQVVLLLPISQPPFDVLPPLSLEAPPLAVEPPLDVVLPPLPLEDLPALFPDPELPPEAFLPPLLPPGLPPELDPAALVPPLALALPPVPLEPPPLAKVPPVALVFPACGLPVAPPFEVLAPPFEVLAPPVAWVPPALPALPPEVSGVVPESPPQPRGSSIVASTAMRGLLERIKENLRDKPSGLVPARRDDAEGNASSWCDVVPRELVKHLWPRNFSTATHGAVPPRRARGAV
jgi:hypothetical protein